MTRVKICGIQEPSDALTALAAGADLLGLVFVPERRRRVDIDRARQVVEAVRDAGPSSPTMVGLFADQAIDEVNRTMRLSGLDMAQLCGRETIDYCAQVEAPVIKVMHVTQSPEVDEAVEALAEELAPYADRGYRITLDRKMEGLQGGTGKRFNWDIARSLSARGVSFLLAGGLSPDNVAQAVRSVAPWGVDVSSGVETNGRKDPAKVRSFIQLVRELDAQLASQRT